MKERLHRPIRWALLVPALFMSLLYLNSTVYCFWVSGGPPTDYPRAWLQRGLIQFSYSASFFVAGVTIFLLLAKISKRRRLAVGTIGAGLILIALAFPTARRWVLVDSCLDRGGAWDSSHFECRYE